MEDFKALNDEIKSLEQDVNMDLQIKKAKGGFTQNEEAELNQKLLLLVEKNKELQQLA